MNISPVSRFISTVIPNSIQNHNVLNKNISFSSSPKSDEVCFSQKTGVVPQLHGLDCESVKKILKKADKKTKRELLLALNNKNQNALMLADNETKKYLLSISDKKTKEKQLLQVDANGHTALSLADKAGRKIILDASSFNLKAKQIKQLVLPMNMLYRSYVLDENSNMVTDSRNNYVFKEPHQVEKELAEIIHEAAPTQKELERLLMTPLDDGRLLIAFAKTTPGINTPDTLLDLVPDPKFIYKQLSHKDNFGTSMFALCDCEKLDRLERLTREDQIRLLNDPKNRNDLFLITTSEWTELQEKGILPETFPQF